MSANIKEIIQKIMDSEWEPLNNNSNSQKTSCPIIKGKKIDTFQMIPLNNKNKTPIENIIFQVNQVEDFNKNEKMINIKMSPEKKSLQTNLKKTIEGIYDSKKKKKTKGP